MSNLIFIMVIVNIFPLDKEACRSNHDLYKFYARDSRRVKHVFPLLITQQRDSGRLNSSAE